MILLRIGVVGVPGIDFRNVVGVVNRGVQKGVPIELVLVVGVDGAEKRNCMMKSTLYFWRRDGDINSSNTGDPGAVGDGTVTGESLGESKSIGDVFPMVGGADWILGGGGREGIRFGRLFLKKGEE